MKKLLSFMMLLFVSLATWAEDDPNWTNPDSYDYQGSTIINFVLNVNGRTLTANDNVKVAAFINGVCRGVTSANSLHNDAAALDYGHLQVLGDNVADQDKDITIKAYVNGLVYKFVKTYTYNGETQGTLSNLETLELIDLKAQGVSAYIEDISLNLENNSTIQKDINAMFHIVYTKPDGTEDDSYTKKTLPAIPETKCQLNGPYDNDGTWNYSGGTWTALKRTTEQGSRTHWYLAFSDGGRIDGYGYLYVTPYEKLYPQCPVSISLDEITVEKGKTVDVRDYLHFYIQRVGAEPIVYNYNDFVNRYLGYDPEFTWEWFLNDNAYYTAEGNTLTGVRGTTRRGESCSMTLHYPGNADVYFSARSTVYITPYDRWDSMVEMRVSDITVDLSDLAEGYDYTQNISFRIPKENQTSVAIEYDEVPYSQLAEVLGYDPGLSFNLTVYREDADYYLSVDNDQMLIRPFRSTDYRGLEANITASGNGWKDGVMANLFITPIDHIATAKSLSVSIDDITLDITKPEGVKILDHAYLNVVLADEDPLRQELTDGILKLKVGDVIDVLADTAAVKFSASPSGYVNFTKDYYMLTPVQRTNRYGLTSTLKVTYKDQTYTSNGRVFVTPIDPFDSMVEVRMLPITVEYDKTVDARDYIIFRFPKENQTSEALEYDEVPMKQLAEKLGYDLAVEYDWNTNEFFSVAADGYTLKGLKHTFKEGREISCSFDFPGKPHDGTPAISTILYVTPFNLFDYEAQMFIDDIQVEKNKTVDLRDYIRFILFDADGTEQEVKFREVESRFGYIPEFRASIMSDCPYISLNGYTVTGEQRTLEPMYAQISLTTTDQSWQDNDFAKVEVFLNFKPIEGIALSYDDEEVSETVYNRFETYDFKIVLTPADADYDLDKFFFMEGGNNIVGTDTYLLAKFVKKDGVPYLQVTPVHAQYDLKFTVSYIDKEYLIQAETSTSMTVQSDIDIQQGWGWYSLYNLPAATSIEAIDANLFDDTMLDVRTRNAATYKDSKYGFFGGVTELDYSTAYQIKTTAAADFKAYVIPDNTYPFHRAWVLNNVITLNHGWNWIVYPYEYNRSFESLRDIFPTTVGNKLVSKADGFVEYGNAGWTGNFEEFSYGQSYLFYNAGETARLVYSSEGRTYGVPEFSTTTPSNRRAAKRQSQWQYDHHAFANNMTIIGEIANVPNAADLTIGAFVGDECRGEGKIVEADGHQYLFITVHGEAKDEVSFRLGNGVTEFDLVETLPFGAAAGTLDAPVRFVAPLTVPTAVPMTTITAENNEAIYDLQGRRVNTATRGITIQNGKAIIR